MLGLIKFVEYVGVEIDGRIIFYGGEVEGDVGVLVLEGYENGF